MKAKRKTGLLNTFFQPKLVSAFSIACLLAPLAATAGFGTKNVTYKNSILSNKGEGALPGALVTLTVGGLSLSTTADREGKWRFQSVVTGLNACEATISSGNSSVTRKLRGSSCSVASSGSSGGSSGSPSVPVPATPVPPAPSAPVATAPAPAGTHNILFVTSSRHTGNLGGLNGADATCNQLASQNFPNVRFKAFLSTTTGNARDRVALTSSIVNSKGVKITDSSLNMPILTTQQIYDENGNVPNDSAYGTAVWTGSDVGGVAFRLDAISNCPKACEDWTSVTFDLGKCSPKYAGTIANASGAIGRVNWPSSAASDGFIWYPTQAWLNEHALNGNTIDCSQQARFYCISEPTN